MILRENSSYTNNELAEERTMLAFIRTCAIFCGLFILLKKNAKLYYINIIPLIIILIIIFRILDTKKVAHKGYIYIISALLIICIFKLLLL